MSAQGSSFCQRQGELSAEELLAAAQREQERLEEAGEIDRIGDVMPEEPPSFETLTGKDLEIRWRYWKRVDEPGKKRKRQQVFIWCVGQVVEVADGRSTKEKPGSKSPLPWGAVRIRFAADEQFEEAEHFVWCLLKPADWNEEVHLGWRYSADELQRVRAAQKGE